MSPQSNVWLTMLKPWMDKVEKESGGRIKFEGYPAIQLGGTPVQFYDQAKNGVVDAVWTLPGNTAGRFLSIEVFEPPSVSDCFEAVADFKKRSKPLHFKNDPPTHPILLQMWRYSSAPCSC